MKLDLQSELYAATGNISGTGVRKSLGTPTLDPLQILVREAAQNAWDARRADGSPVNFRVEIRTLTSPQQRALRNLLSELPSAGPTRVQLEQTLNRSPLSVMQISDRGTTGLGGPVRADEEPHPGDRPDFVNFFRNVGSPRDRHFGAGTYGYGKSSMYRFSRSGTIIGYTQTSCADRNVTRLMAASIGDGYGYRRRRYTGRHWWGTEERGSVVDPLGGAGAHTAAEALGLERRGTHERGTSILILDPDFEERTSAQAGNAIVECLAWFFWPKMIPEANGLAPMIFEVLVDGSECQAIDLHAFPPLEIFADAMSGAKSINAKPIRCERPIQLLGTLGFARGPRRPRRVLDTGSEQSLIPERAACVALMRPAELVVRYLQGQPLTSDLVEYGGVFICDGSVEVDFAAAEPPAHDDWIAENLEGRARTFVRVALRRIQSTIDEYAGPPVQNDVLPDLRSLALLGDALGNVILGQRGSRLGTADASGGPAPGPTSSRRNLRVSEPEPFRFAMVRKIPCAIFRVRITSRGTARVKLQAQPLIVLEGGARISPEHGDAPRVVGWLDAKGDLVAEGIEIALSVSGDDVLHVALSIRDDAAITVGISEAVEQT